MALAWHKEGRAKAWNVYIKVQHAFYVKGQMVNIVGIAVPAVAVTATHGS